MQSLVSYLAAGTTPPRNLDLNQPLIVDPPDPDIRDATVTLPDGRRLPAQIRQTQGRPQIEFDQTQRPGIYTLRYQHKTGQRQFQFVVRPPREESDLTPLPPQRWNHLAQSLGFDTMNAATLAPIARPPDRELWAPLLAGVFLLALLEMLLSRHWSQGGQGSQAVLGPVSEGAN